MQATHHAQVFVVDITSPIPIPPRLYTEEAVAMIRKTTAEEANAVITRLRDACVGNGEKITKLTMEVRRLKKRNRALLERNRELLKKARDDSSSSSGDDDSNKDNVDGMANLPDNFEGLFGADFSWAAE